ncbi:cyclin-T1-4-like [Phalaenopsis equestris]|uniref:cyclin-T1-4-like n=1 Tax=Phalaenopsis equestris TaxID=78828 RepID=UPI0009E50824|nr:cyclin-T1-4-like [Phalaenopsis equestris]XP_020575632.1 cyclin-T1-4-like [Phalaenopsis equestris]XP_020575633.1 cyclin-T1-4-like [Phalaenopsis equestris]XP_020575634.1 cyclin-T1-4-like [Phalaenopsis equestris]XP_020575635.1 cyclin-T1-4-like [Phalaenopsis equestris]
MSGYAMMDSSQYGLGKYRPQNGCNEKLSDYGARWYFSRQEIEENSPSRSDGIDANKEAYLRKSYSTFLQDLGMRLQVPQVTIATAIVFCHRFFLRQSHAKNDRRTIATVCMFLAGKVEETPRRLMDVIRVSYEIIHKKSPLAAQKMKRNFQGASEQQKELILMAEKLVLATLGFDLNVQHPYRPLVEAIKKFKVAKCSLAKVAWNFVNDGLRTSLCLQFHPQHIAAGAIFLAAKFIKVKLPADGDRTWWQEFNVTPRQLEDISNQLLELYEQNPAAQSSHGNVADGNSFAGTSHLPAGTTSSAVSETSASVNNARQGAPAVPPFLIRIRQSNADDTRFGSQIIQIHKNGKACSADSRSGVWDHNSDRGIVAEDLNSSKCDRGIVAEAVSAVENIPKFQNDAKIQLSMADEKMEQEKMKGWQKPIHSLEKCPLPASIRRKPNEFGNDNGGDRCKLEDGELSSLNEHDYSSQLSQSYNAHVSGTVKRKPDETWSDHSGRDHKRVR